MSDFTKHILSVIASKELHCCVHGKVVEVVFVMHILGQGMAELLISRTRCVRCGCDEVGTLGRARNEKALKNPQLNNFVLLMMHTAI